MDNLNNLDLLLDKVLSSKEFNYTTPKDDEVLSYLQSLFLMNKGCIIKESTYNKLLITLNGKVAEFKITDTKEFNIVELNDNELLEIKKKSKFFYVPEYNQTNDDISGETRMKTIVNKQELINSLVILSLVLK